MQVAGHTHVPSTDESRIAALLCDMRPARHRLLEGWTLWSPTAIVADDVLKAVGWGRIRGLLGRTDVGETEALIIGRCKQIHTIGMQFAIDAVFVDEDLEVLHVATMPPGRKSPRVRGARSCIELAGGRAKAAGVGEGVRLELRAPGSR